MDTQLNLQLRQSAAARAHLHGAEAVILEKEAAALLEQARQARRRYFRELETCDLLGGHESPFSSLGREA